MDVLESARAISSVNKEGADSINSGCCTVVVPDSDKTGMGVNDNSSHIHES